MPYTKKKTYRKRTYKRRQPKRLQNKNLDRRIKKLEHSEELKYIDYSDNALLQTGGRLVALSLLAQGDDFNQRIGEQVQAKYLNLKMTFNKSTPSANINWIRVLVLWDLQTNGIGPIQLASTSLVTGVIDDTTIASILAPHNYRTKQRYKILHDKLYINNPDSTTTERMFQVKRNIKLGGATIKYNSSAGTTAALSSRSLWILTFCDSDSPSEISPYITARVWYTDA